MAGWREVAKRLQELERGSVQVGWFDDAKYPNGMPVGRVAAIQEKGSVAKRIPPRPFLRPAIEENGPGWSAFAARQIKAVAAGSVTPSSVFALLGTDAAGAVKQKISAVNSPAISERTLDARRRRGIETTKPLYATGLMFATCTFKVIK